MKNPWIFLFALAFAGAAHAQYRWVDKDGKTRYGDSPPAGVKATALGAPASGSAPAAPAAASTAAKKGPLTAAEREQDYRKRQAEAKKADEKSAKESESQAAKAENCTRAKEYKATLETGRVARTNAAGERYYMDEDQIAQELAKSQQTVQKACN
jgi:Domain of unknown function (DUF4124)